VADIDGEGWNGTAQRRFPLKRIDGTAVLD
jgi:hypothetical protein